MEKIVAKDTICEELGISLATINNWIKTKVIPPPDSGNYYTKKTYKEIITSIKNNPKRLNSRANRSLAEKKSISFHGITNKQRKFLLTKLVNDFEKSKLSIDDGILGLFFTILKSNKLIETNWQINKKSKLDIFLSELFLKTHNPEIVKTIFKKYDIPNLDDDLLGAFYQSIQSISQKSNSGSYYTPPELLSEIKIPSNKTILDPCCGSGSILLNIISKKHDPAKIYAWDIDEVALKICYINLVLFFNNINIKPNIAINDITQNIETKLAVKTVLQFDFIVTNPPWGSKFTIEQKKTYHKLYPQLNTSETFSIALYNAQKMLNKNGALYFFLPYSFLNVSTHKNIRRIVFNNDNKIYIKLLGNCFKGVLSESILFGMEKSLNEKEITIQSKKGKNYTIPIKNITAPDYIITGKIERKDALILKKIYSNKHITLSDAIFALGIVTGNNKKHLLNKKTAISQAIYRGKDIEKYTLKKPVYYIDFKPKKYQQTPPADYYDKTKIIYRFISDKLVCALDKKKNLILNSANLLISKDYPMETIVSFFNSDIYTFIFKKKFHSKKVLKSHLQDLPLPLLTDKIHQYINKLYYETLKDKNWKLYQEKIDSIICETFKINKEQYLYIKSQI